MRNLTLRQIRIFVGAAQYKSFARTAEALHITPSAVTQQIKEMENDLGLILFDREKRNVSLNSAGKKFLAYAIKILDTLDEAQEALEILDKKYEGILSIGAVSTTRFFLPLLLNIFQKQHPKIQLKVDIKNRAQLIEMLYGGNIDLAIMGKPPSTLQKNSFRFAPHPHVFISSALHPLANQRKLSPEVLNKQQIIFREEGSGTFFIMKSFFEKYHIKPSAHIEIAGNETIKQAIIADLGVSLVSAHTISQELKNKQIAILDILNTPILRDWCVVLPQKRKSTKQSLAFLKFIQDNAPGVLGKMFP